MGGGASRASVEAAILQQRRRLHEKIRKRFARFGDEVLSIMLGFAFQPKRMPVLIQRLNIRAGGHLDDQFDAVWDFIASHGSGEFLRRVKQKSIKEEVEAADVETLVSGDLDINSFEDMMGFEHEPDPRIESGSPRVNIVERRSGKDRRKGNDRRQSIEAIPKNKRFGRDRRQRPKGRRKTDI